MLGRQAADTVAAASSNVNGADGEVEEAPEISLEMQALTQVMQNMMSQKGSGRGQQQQTRESDYQRELSFAKLPSYDGNIRILRKYKNK